MMSYTTTCNFSRVCCDEQEIPTPAQTLPREPPPPYSEAQALAAQSDHGDVGSTTNMGGGDAANSPPPYHQHLQPSPMSTAPRPSNTAAAAGWQAQQKTAAAAQPAGFAVAAVTATAGGGAAVAPPAAAAGARKLAPPRPPMEREDFVLKKALSRRKESLRRLEDVRAGARARLAALKAETDARRAAKLAASGRAKGKDGAAKVPPSPPLPQRPAGTSGADAIPAVAGHVAPEPLPASGDRAVGPTHGGDVLAGGPAGALPRGDDSDGLGGRKGRDIVAIGADGGVHRGGRVVADRPERPTGTRRQVPRRKEAVQKKETTEEEEEEEAKKKEEKNTKAGVAELARKNKEEGQEENASIAVVPPMPALPAEVKSVEGFKALWRETVKVRPVRVSSSGGEATTAAAKEADARENLARPSVQEAGVGLAEEGEEGQGFDDGVDDDEVEAGWAEVDLSGKEAGDEVRYIGVEWHNPILSACPC